MKKLITLAFILLLAFSNLYGFDGERKGFIFGGGIGVNFLSISDGNSDSDSESITAFLMNLKIGYAPSNTLEIFWTSKPSLFIGSGDDLTMFGLGAVAATFYFDNTSETGWFASGGIGYSTYGKLSGSSSSSSDFGFGVFGGGGYEFAAHWSVEVDLLHSSNEKRNFFGVLVSINVLGF